MSNRGIEKKKYLKPAKELILEILKSSCLVKSGIKISISDVKSIEGDCDVNIGKERRLWF